jgi:rhamnogalacturonan hydrolase
MLLIKSNGGNGSVSESSFKGFIGHNNAYSLDIDGYWIQQDTAAGDGVFFTGLTFDNWKGDCGNGVAHWPVNIKCPDGAPCTGITISDFAIWTDVGDSELYICRSAWGSGACLRYGSAHTSYAGSTITVTAAP